MKNNKNTTEILNEMIPLLSFHSKPGQSLWAVGGGKGGTGKSFITACLGIELASRDGDVVLIDADLGGPNLHTILGMKEANIDLGHFITNKTKNLRDTLVTTPFPGLSLVKGTDNILFTANLNYYKKLKLIRHIKAFESKRVIVDIGTGTFYNCLDFFILSNPGILVVNPEPTSIENAYYFLKSCIIRILKLYIEHYKIQELIIKIADQIQDTSKSIYSFLNEVISHDRYYAQVFFTALQNFRPCLIINKARDDRDAILGESISKVVQKYLVIDINFLGVVPFDEKVHWSLKEMKPFMKLHPKSEVSAAIKSIVDRLIGLKQKENDKN